MKKKSRQRRTITVDGVFDIETEDWDRFVCGSLVTSWQSRSYWWSSETRMVDDLLGFEGCVWAHNGGRFDCLWLLEHIVQRGLRAQIGLAGHRIVYLQCGKLEVRDSAALIPISLKKAATIGKVGKTSTGLDCDCGEACGGYCNIRRLTTPEKQQTMIDYCVQDCKALFSTLRELSAYAEAEDLDLRGTIGASAWATAARWCGLEAASWTAENSDHSDTQNYKFARKGYFGGRNQVFAPRCDVGHRYDVRSAYPAALSQLSIPHGSFKRTSKPSEVARLFDRGSEGIFSGAVHVDPSVWIPVLPYRSHQRISFPIGPIYGTWTAHELRYALEVGAAKILDFGECLTWSDSSPLLAPFVDRVWKLRARSEPRSALGTWLKLFLNALTGKVAMNPELQTFAIYAGEDKPPPCTCPTGYGKLCQCENWQPLNFSRSVWAKTSWAIPDCGHVQWAAYLTSQARVNLHRELVSSPYRDAVYCDTDSVFSVVERPSSEAEELGTWRHEGQFAEFQAYAPKVYSYHDPATGEFVAKAKGVPDAVLNWSRLKDGIKVKRGVLSFRAAMQEDRFFIRKEYDRRVSEDAKWYGDRLLAEDGRTYATTVANLNARELGKELDLDDHNYQDDFMP